MVTATTGPVPRCLLAALVAIGLLLIPGAVNAHDEAAISSYHCRTDGTDAYISGSVTVGEADPPHDTLSCEDGHTVRVYIMDSYTYNKEWVYKSAALTSGIILVDSRTLYCYSGGWKGYGMPSHYPYWTNTYDSMTCHTL